MSPESISIASACIALLAAGGAWGAIISNRWNAKETIRAQINIGARNSRAAVVSANRQKWIDAIRDDIAEYIATRAHISKLANTDVFKVDVHVALQDQDRHLHAKLVMLRARVEMRLNPEEEEHEALLAAMDRYYEHASPARDFALRTKARGIFKVEWTRLKKEASGINPFVREGVPERK